MFNSRKEEADAVFFHTAPATASSAFVTRFIFHRTNVFSLRTQDQALKEAVAQFFFTRKLFMGEANEFCKKEVYAANQR